MREAEIFCSELCKDEAKFVRYSRACERDGRNARPDVQQALRIRLAHILADGYPERARQLPSSVREAARLRDEGRCRACGKPGNEIDHVRGNSNDLGNLQLLCSECHIRKTTSNFVRISAETHPEAWAKHQGLLARIRAREPMRFCDREDWDKIWRRLLSSREDALRRG
jgi:hypothetical protein